MKIKIFRLFIASFELIFAAMLWGFGFVAVVWALPSWTPSELIFLRMLIGSAAGLAISVLIHRNKHDWFKLSKLAVVPGFWLTVMMFFQTWGLRYTTATKSGFITILYIVLVPLFAGFFENRKTPLAHWFCILISLFGVALIVDFSWDSPLNLGDGLTFAGAIAAAMHIIAVDKISGRVNQPFLFNSFQSFWACWMAAIVLVGEKKTLIPNLNATELAWAGLLFTALGATLIAFYLQVRAQKILSPTVSSLFFLLESPFAMLFGFLILNEQLSSRAMIGAFFIMLSALIATVIESKRKKS